jgi:hypothetical protein
MSLSSPANGLSFSQPYSRSMLMKTQTMILTAAAALLLATVTNAQVTLSDIGATAPTPGTYDISQLLNVGSGNPPGLNYYWDNGANNGTTSGYTGQTFTTLGSSAGYTLTSVAIQTGGGGGGGELTNQSFTLNIYQVSGTGLTNATLLNTFTATSALNAEGDWMQWTGLGVNLAPNSSYAYGFGRSPGSPGDWELLSTDTNNAYAGGQVCEIIDAGGAVKYSTANNYDAAFDIGLALPSAPIPAPPVETPASASLAMLAGSTNVTLTATSAGLTPISWQWQTDGGTGTTPTNIPGATSSNLVVTTTGWANGVYVYDFVASNTLGVATSPTANIVITNVFMTDIGSNTPTPGPIDIAQLSHIAQNDDGFNYYTDDGAGHSAWAGQTFTTGTNTSGYVMTSLSWLSDGNGSGFPNIQLYDLYVFSISDGGTNATQIASYQAYGGGTEFDWFQWVGLFVPLAPNTQYAYAFGRDSTAGGWEHIGTQGGNPYPGGQLCTIFPPTGGMVTYGTSGGSDTVFDIGLIVSQKPFANVPTYTPNVNPVYAGTVVTLSELGVGTPPLSYQWLADNGTGGSTWTPVGGATHTNLVVDTTALAANNYEYEVVVTNASGAATSAPVTLNVASASAPLVINDISPAPADEGYVGQTLTYSASFAGTLPINYQWMVNTGTGATPISGVSNPSALTPNLVLSNLQAGEAGTYSLNASNAVGGPVSSSTSTLTVLPDLAAPASGTYGALVLSNSPVAYWRLNETEDPSTGILPAYDASGNNLDGLYGVYAGDDVAGPQSPAWPGFEANNTALETVNGIVNSYVTVPPLNLKTNTVTITMWINPTTPAPASGGLLVSRNSGNTDAAGLGFGGATNLSGANLGYWWNANSAATYNYNSGLYPLQGQWSFVALVISPADATFYLYYIDPNTSLPVLSSAVNPVTNGVETFNPAGGTNLIGSDSYSLTSRTFGGKIDEVAVFNQALTSGQILAMFSKAAGLGGVAPQITGQPKSVGTFPNRTVAFTATGINGTTPLAYQWQYITATTTNKLSDGGDISGSLTPTLTIANATSTNVGSYQLIVTNSAGVTASSVASLSVVTPVPGSYEATVLQYDPLAFWPLNETSVDPASGNALAFEYANNFVGVYQVGAKNGFDSILGPESPAFPGFPAVNTALETTASTVNCYVSASAGTMIAANLTYTMWINPSGPAENWAGLLMDRGAAGEGLGFGGSVDGTGMSELGYTWNQNSTWSFNSGLYPPTNQWSFVAMVIGPTKGTLYLIGTNGVVQSASDAIAQDSEEFGVAWHIGADGNNNDRNFPGSISSVAVFLSALSSNQVVTLADIGLGITPPPPEVTVDIAPSQTTPGSLTLSWSQGTLLQTTNLAGPWTTNSTGSPYTVAPTNAQMFFKVKVQ